MLARGPQRDLALFDLRDDGVRLHRVLVDGGKDVLPLDDEVGSREDSLDLAAIDVVPEADVPVGRGQLAESVEEPRAQRSLVHVRCVRCHGLLDRPDDLEFLVVDDDPLEGSGSGRLVLGSDCGNRLAGKSHPVDGHHWSVADGVTPVRVEVGEVRCRQYADDARHLLGVLRVDGGDPRVRLGRSQDFSMKHVRRNDVTGELGLATQFLVGVAARDRSPDRAGADPHLFEPAHVVTPASSQTASRIPR